VRKYTLLNIKCFSFIRYVTLTNIQLRLMLFLKISIFFFYEMQNYIFWLCLMYVLLQ